MDWNRKVGEGEIRTSNLTILQILSFTHRCPFHLPLSLNYSPHYTLASPNFSQQIKSIFPTIHRKNETDIYQNFSLPFRLSSSLSHRSHNEKQIGEKSGRNPWNPCRGEINISPLSRSIAVTRAALFDCRI